MIKNLRRHIKQKWLEIAENFIIYNDNGKSHTIGFLMAFLEKYGMVVWRFCHIPLFFRYSTCKTAFSGYFPTLRRNYAARSSNLIRKRSMSSCLFSRGGEKQNFQKQSSRNGQNDGRGNTKYARKYFEKDRDVE